MSYNVWFDKEPGRYVAAQTVNWVVSDQVNFFTVSQGDKPASISEYIAYDTLSPPGPFIAVTQDGTGNVVYDGGFPKFYNTAAPPAGISPSITMEFKATNDGTATSGNAYYYNAFTDLPVTIAAGDRLVYDMLQDNVNARVGIDAVTAANASADPTHYSLRDWLQPISVLRDQNGLSVHPATDLGSRAVNQWYHREFDLTQCAGYTFLKWSMAYEGEVPGTFATRFRDVYILDSTGKIKAILFKDTMKLPGNTSAEGGASGYSNLSKTTYDPRGQLTASFKYLFNAINWTANPAKVTAGIKKILILGDTPATGNYSVKGTDVSGFFNSFTNLCAAAGYTPTFKVPGDYSGGYLDPTLAELNNYCCVLVMGAVGGGTALITDAGVSNLVAARAAGLGIILITDDGPDITTIGGAYPPPQVARQFFVTVNKIAVQFGAWFTGNYDRTPVNVGFLRSTYGDHPLYGGMLDSESIQAGGSESKVMITPFTKYSKAALPAPLQFTALGRYIVQVTAKLKDGTAESFRVVFIIGDGNIIKWTRKGSTTEITSLDLGLDWQASLDLLFDTIGLGTLSGSLYQNNTKIGTVSSTDAGGGSVVWTAGTSANLRLKHGDVLKAAFETPLQASASLPVTRINLGTVPNKDVAPIVQKLKAWATGIASSQVLTKLFQGIQALVPAGTYTNNHSNAGMIRAIRNFIDNGFAVPPFAPMLLSPLSNSKFVNPVTGAKILPQYKVFSVTYGWQNLPANLTMLYYNNINFPAGTYVFMGAADDQLTVEIDGVVKGNLGGGYTEGSAVASFEVTLSAGVHVLKLTNVNVPANTPGYWYMVIVDKATGAIFHQPTPDTWRSNDVIG